MFAVGQGIFRWPLTLHHQIKYSALTGRPDPSGDDSKVFYQNGEGLANQVTIFMHCPKHLVSFIPRAAQKACPSK